MIKVISHLVIGMGEVGTALQSILQCNFYDKSCVGIPIKIRYDFLHICFPYSATFENDVLDYQKIYGAKIVVVHSTVPIGTCDKFGWTHSPIRGKHPNLRESILKIDKMIGGKNAVEVKRELQKYGIKSHIYTYAKDTEAGKLYDLMQYAVSILLQKHIAKQCQKLGLNFDTVYTQFNKSYNEGWIAMGFPEYVRPIIWNQPGPIGGHCVIPMMELLGDELAKDIIKANKNL